MSETPPEKIGLVGSPMGWRLWAKPDDEGLPAVEYVRADIAGAEAATALAERERERDHWHDCFVALNKAVVGSPGLSAITVAPKLRDRAEKAEAMLARVPDVLGPLVQIADLEDAAGTGRNESVLINVAICRAARALYEEVLSLAKADGDPK